VEIGAGFEEMGGEGVAERVNAALLVDPGAKLRHHVDLLRHGDVDRSGALAVLEEPHAGRRCLPVRAQVLEQPLGERDVAVLRALALRDPDRHAVDVDVRDLEGDRLADAKTRGVDDGQDEPMTRMRRRGEQPPHFLAAEDLGELLGLLGQRDHELGPRAAERDVVQEAEGVGSLATRAPGELAIVDQVREVRLDFVVGDLVRRPAIVLRQPDHGGDVRLVGPRRESANGHVAHHAGPELGHGAPPGCGELPGGDGASTRGVPRDKANAMQQCPSTRKSETLFAPTASAV
jgi:hypothetical protein